MRNKHGIEVKKGHWVSGVTRSGKDFEGRVLGVDRHGERVTVQVKPATPNQDGSAVFWVNDITQTLGPMTLGKDGIVTQNPLVRVKVTSPMQRPRKTKAGGVTTAPGARQVARRKKTAGTKVKGVYANPAPHSFPWLVETQVKGVWGVRANFASKPAAVAYAQALADANDKTVRVRKAGT